jgi:hypothetical protein
MTKLIGTDPNQVPSNADLGTAAYMDANDILTSREATLSGIYGDIKSTSSPQDVFVYDTSKDSDGGAWRKRTQHTSWYNEELNTAYRGSRREFPAVAIIVVDSPKITIYDADDPSLPMWMSFWHRQTGQTGGTTTNIHGGSGDFNLAKMKNATLVMGCGGSGGRGANFIKDSMTVYYTPSAGLFTPPGGIADRNRPYSSWIDTNEDYIQLPHAQIYDLDITVLSGAPIDPKTGIQVPTIAIGTAQGVAVKSDNGDTYTLGNSSGSNYALTVGVHFTKNEQIQIAMDASQRFLRTFDIPTSSFNVAQWTPTADDGITVYNSPAYGDVPNIDYQGITTKRTTENAVGGAKGVLQFKAREDDYSKSLFNYITNTYNSGWLVGDHTLATCSDTDDSPHPDGVNGITAGSVPSGATGGVSGGVVNVTSTLASNTCWIVPITLEAGKTYQVSMIRDSGTDPFTRVYGPWTTQYAIDRSFQGTGTVVTRYFKATSNGTSVSFVGASSYSVFVASSITIREAISDRMGEVGTGVTVYGDIRKTPVAPGAELIAYDGFSTANKLWQKGYNDNAANGSYRSQIAQLTDKCFIAWIKVYENSAYQYIFSLSDDASYHYGFAVFQTSGNLYTYDQEHGISQASNAKVNDGRWHQAILIDDETTKKIYLDGELVHTVSHAYNMNSSGKQNMSLRIGSYANDQNIMTNGSISLFRVSGDIPSDDQIRKMYYDERPLFYPDAKCTIYGGNASIAAVDRDPHTDELHVGTASGRSVFNGLTRTYNTTKAVTSSISAIDGLVAEE